MAEPTIQVLPDMSALAFGALEHFIEAGETAIRERGVFSVALSGGTTPVALYQMIAAAAPWQPPSWPAELQWDKVEIYFSDERCVPPTHSDSNFHTIDDAMLADLPIPPQNIHRMRGEDKPEAAAAEYSRLLRERFGPAGGMDLVLLGMGEDGHTASLFPHSAALKETEKPCIANFVEKLQSWRLTLTAPFINRAREVLILVAGPAKAAKVEEALQGARDPDRLPVQLIDPTDGKLFWLLDAAAAGM